MTHLYSIHSLPLCSSLPSSHRHLGRSHLCVSATDQPVGFVGGGKRIKETAGKVTAQKLSPWKSEVEKCDTMNGPVDGLCDHSLSEEGAFMFTSESVGEGHPGK